MTELSALQARVVAALFEVGHIRAIATHPATLDELTDIERSLDAVATFFVHGIATDRAKDIELALVGARRRLHAIHNALASLGRNAIVQPGGGRNLDGP